ncbi:MAG: Ribosomal RNA large subunit methyltransferase I [Syntrophorhabdus sp. PtaB.Bin184]|jgi:23S rRNA (cytosine1962-C5)-methyltransferase|nr:MAG: Ribosomal RNA large subunit methyltransferase I [Syntrophorhabdus sp. PtaB.Bin184]
MVKLTVRKDRSGPVRGFHPWVFSKALVSIPEGLAPGEPVELYDESGSLLASGYFNSYGQISVRLWGHEKGEPVGMAFFARRMERAGDIRRRYVERPGTNAYRMVNGESDLLPGLIVDRYGEYLVVQFHTRGIERWKAEIVESLVTVFRPRGIWERSDVPVRSIENLGAVQGLLHGNVPDIIEIVENGLKFLVDVKEGQKTGFFLDQRDKRSAFTKYAKDRDVLNCFCYTGGFTVYAMAGGARRVVSVDSSRRALELAKDNIALNGFDTSRCEFVCDDAKRYLREPASRFEAIVLDPPAFIKDRRKKQEGLVGYRAINEIALRSLSPEGILATCSCSAHLSLGDFRFLLSEAGAKVGRPITILETHTHGIDHPQLVPFTEGEYLKCFFLKA